MPTKKELEAEVQRLNALFKEAEAEVERLRAEVDSVKAMHNGYDPEARKNMPGLKEPQSLVEAVRSLIEEAEELARGEKRAEDNGKCTLPMEKGCHARNGDMCMNAWVCKPKED